MLQNISHRFNSIVKSITGKSIFSEDNIKEIISEVRIALLEADVNLNVVRSFIEAVKEEALGEKVLGSLTPAQALVGIVRDQMIKLLGASNVKLNLSCTPPAVIMVVGLQGCGKTTTTVKLAHYLQQHDKKKVLVVSVDVYRPSAIDQLSTFAKASSIECYPSTVSQLPLDIAISALDYAKLHFFDVVIVDTAGRLAIDEDMMHEIQQIHEKISPIETIFVADAMLGQESVNTASAFNSYLSLTGLILTKTDGDARGGAALSIKAVTGVPIKFLGNSEKVAGLEPFHPDRLAKRILGMGDILSLVDEVKSKVDKHVTQKMVHKVKHGKDFDLNDLLAQLLQMSKLGGIGNILDKLPFDISKKSMGVLDDNIVRTYVAIIHSMTIDERSDVSKIKSSRKIRIAKGSGTSVQWVNRLLDQYKRMSDMMKKLRGSGGNNFLKNLISQFK